MEKKTYEEAYQMSKEYFEGNDIAANVYLGKYALKNEQGDILEPTPEYMHRRLAREFARIENKYPNPMSEEKIFGYLNRFRYIIPQGSPMAGIGNPYQVMSLSNCFLPGTKVYTTNGYKNIENVEIGDVTITHTGKHKKVVQKHANKLNGRKVYAVTTHGNIISLFVTENHRLMAVKGNDVALGIKPRYIPVSDLRVGDYVQIGSFTEDVEVKPINMLDIFTKSNFDYCNRKYRIQVIEQNDKKYLQMSTYYSKRNDPAFRLKKNISRKFLSFLTINDLEQEKEQWHLKLSSPSEPISSIIDIDEDFAYLLGYFYSRSAYVKINYDFNTKFNESTGVVTKINLLLGDTVKIPEFSGIRFEINYEDKAIIDKVESFIKKYNLCSYRTINGEKTLVCLDIDNNILALLFDYLFGSQNINNTLGASDVDDVGEKRALHPMLYTWPRRLVLHFAAGFIDGLSRKNGEITEDGLFVHGIYRPMVPDIFRFFRSRGIAVSNYYQSYVLRDSLLFHKEFLEEIPTLRQKLTPSEYDNRSELLKLEKERKELEAENDIIYDILENKLSENVFEEKEVFGNLKEERKKKIENKEKRKAKFIKIDGNLFVRIDRIREEKKMSKNLDTVYTLGVEDDHSYTVETVIAENCFVIESPYDSYGGILKTDQEEAQIMKRRGGVGFDISTIRPKGLPTANAAQTTDGIGVFMERFSNTCREVAQGGRRGALMLTISVHHPEIRTFIHIKEDLKKVTGANISIRVSDEFMNAVRNNEKYELRFPVDSKNPIISEFVDANEVWNEIVATAHKCAEPGVLFWDTVMQYCPANSYPQFKTVSTNPCGEITLSPYDSCRLLLVNALSFVENPFTEKASFNWSKFALVAQDAQRLMDDLVDLEYESVEKIIRKVESDPEPQHVKQIEYDLWVKIREACLDGRRTGLGLTAVGDTIAALNMKYGSEESIQFVEDLYKTLCINSYYSSIMLAKERGPFRVFSFSIEEDNKFLQRVWEAAPWLYEEYKKYGRRNIANLTTPPAGSTSMLAKSVIGFGTTSGIENVPYIMYIRRKKYNPNDKDFRCDYIDELGDKWQEFKVYHSGFSAWKQVTGYTDNDIEKSPYWGATIDDVDWVAKVRLQGAAQKWVDHAISNTTNLPEDITVDLVKQVYMTGWEVGCKGITIYRKGSRSGVILDSNSNKAINEIKENHAPKRPSELECDVHHMVVDNKEAVFLVGKLNNKPYEIFSIVFEDKNVLPKQLKVGKIIKLSGTEKAKYNLQYFDSDNNETKILENIGNINTNSIYDVLSRSMSLSLRHGVPIQFIVEQLIKGNEKNSKLYSFSKAAIRVLKKYIQDGAKTTFKKCSNCKSSKLAFQSGCVTCLECGHSKCD